jgi:hypothetical protein
VHKNWALRHSSHKRCSRGRRADYRMSTRPHLAHISRPSCLSANLCRHQRNIYPGYRNRPHRHTNRECYSMSQNSLPVQVALPFASPHLPSVDTGCEYTTSPTHTEDLSHKFVQSVFRYVLNFCSTAKVTPYIRHTRLHVSPSTTSW